MDKDVENIILYELRELRKEVTSLKTELALFKGKAFGMIAFLSVLSSTAWQFIIGKK